MTVRLFIIGSVFAAVSGLGSLYLTVTSLSPEGAGPVGFTLFFLSLFVGIASLFGLAGYIVRRTVLPQAFPAYLVRTSVRQGLLLGSFMALLMFLQLLRLYRWWIAIIIIAVFLSLELVFLSYDRVNRRKPAAD